MRLAKFGCRCARLSDISIRRNIVVPIVHDLLGSLRSSEAVTLDIVAEFGSCVILPGTTSFELALGSERLGACLLFAYVGRLRSCFGD